MGNLSAFVAAAGERGERDGSEERACEQMSAGCRVGGWREGRSAWRVGHGDCSSFIWDVGS